VNCASAASLPKPGAFATFFEFFLFCLLARAGAPVLQPVESPSTPINSSFMSKDPKAFQL